MTAITINPTSTPNFFDVLSSNEYDHYPLLVEQAGITCGCLGFTRWHHCKHADQAAATITFHEETSEVKPVAVPDTDGKEITCPCCGAWMMAWAWEKHLRGNFCEMYLEEKARAAKVAPAPAPVPGKAADIYAFPFAA